jgi:electron transport complex protein RnfD
MHTPALKNAPHIHSGRSVQAMMQFVLMTLLPGVLVQMVAQGIGVVAQIVIATIAAVAAEALALHLRAQLIRLALSDGSVLITAILFGLAMPPTAVWWLGTLGIIFAVIVAKHAFGGLGNNLFNPAMAGYALLLVCYPHAMQSGMADSLSNTFAAISGSYAPGVDAITGATVLEATRAGLQGMAMMSEIRAANDLSLFSGHSCGWINAAFLFGGLGLLFLRVIRWQIPVGFLCGMLLVASVLWLGDAQRHASPMFHLFSGATMLGAFYIATDPVTSPVAPYGRIIFGLGAGALTMVIRRFGIYPDGVAFAVLLMNALTPLIDRHTRPRVLGEPQQ